MIFKYTLIIISLILLLQQTSCQNIKQDEDYRCLSLLEGEWEGIQIFFTNITQKKLSKYNLYRIIDFKFQENKDKIQQNQNSLDSQQSNISNKYSGQGEYILIASTFQDHVDPLEKLVMKDGQCLKQNGYLNFSNDNYQGSINLEGNVIQLSYQKDNIAGSVTLYKKTTTQIKQQKLQKNKFTEKYLNQFYNKQKSTLKQQQQNTLQLPPFNPGQVTCDDLQGYWLGYIQYIDEGDNYVQSCMSKLNFELESFTDTVEFDGFMYEDQSGCRGSKDVDNISIIATCNMEIGQLNNLSIEFQGQSIKGIGVYTEDYLIITDQNLNITLYRDTQQQNDVKK